MDKIKEDIILKYVMSLRSLIQGQLRQFKQLIMGYRNKKKVSYLEQKPNLCSIVGLKLVFVEILLLSFLKFEKSVHTYWTLYAKSTFCTLVKMIRKMDYPLQHFVRKLTR